MSEFWFISVPAERNSSKKFKETNDTLSKLDISRQSIFKIPELKVGTLDVLIGLADELQKLDTYAESICRKIAHYMGEVLEEQKSKLLDNLQVNSQSPANFMLNFEWDAAKYPIKQSLRTLYDILAEQISKIDSDLKTKSSVYNTIKGNLTSLEKKQSGSLMTRSLQDIVKREHFVLNSEMLSTLLVVVPKHLYGEWKNKYETLVKMVVPRSSELIFEDQDYGLWNVTVFQILIEDFTNRCRENKFHVRDFVYDEKKIEESKSELSKLENDKKKQFVPLFRWLKVNFGESFSALVHVKAIRVFVESVLRYGLPIDFCSFIVQPQKKHINKLKVNLGQIFSHLDTVGDNNPDDEMNNVTMGIPSISEYYPYVFFKIELANIENV